MLISSANSKNITPITASVLLLCSLGIGLSGCAADSTAGTMTPTATGKPSSTSVEKKAIETNSPLPTPSGTLVAKLEFTCDNLVKQLALSGFSSDTAFVPEASSAEARAVSSGGSTCRWQGESGDKWVTASVERIAPEDYRDIAESLRGFFEAANFGSTNDSLEFYSQDGHEGTSKVLNKTYLITIISNSYLSVNELGKLARECEALLTENTY
jgi:hypothetical protein